MATCPLRGLYKRRKTGTESRGSKTRRNWYDREVPISGQRRLRETFRPGGRKGGIRGISKG